MFELTHCVSVQHLFILWVDCFIICIVRILPLLLLDIAILQECKVTVGRMFEVLLGWVSQMGSGLMLENYRMVRWVLVLEGIERIALSCSYGRLNRHLQLMLHHRSMRCPENLRRWRR